MNPSDIKVWGQRAQAMIEALSACSSDDDRLTRHYLSPAHEQAIALVSDWMAQAGLEVSRDAAATVHGLGGDASAKRLLVGSHIDTVANAGRFDGTLGVIAGILAWEVLRERGIDLPFAVEVLAFGDEEGARFPQALVSSSALAGQHDPEALSCEDQDGVSMRSALEAFGGDPDALGELAYDPDQVRGYLEVHIEQGPVLEAVNKPLGVVTAIAGQARYRIQVVGVAGHAGTVPMDRRNDALAAAAEMVSAIEREALRYTASSLVATVGELDVDPGSANVIPGRVDFSLDVRAANDQVRARAYEAMSVAIQAIADRRRVSLLVKKVMDKPVAAVAPRMREAIARALARVGPADPPRLMSGAGHDGHALVHLTDIGMIFVRCEGGISHHPLEFVLPDDMGLAVLAVAESIRELAKEVS